MIRYSDLDPTGEKKLNQIVMAGSHDAGITGGKSNTKTQDLDIGAQAAAGVRVFDLRVTAAAGSKGPDGVKQAQLQAFHAAPSLMKNETKSRFVPEVNRVESITRTKLKGGDFGLGLTAMLEQARSFVENNGKEFLILKFDKCTNWELIAEVCVSVLGGTIYRATANLNTTPLRNLGGKVICLFTPPGLAAIPPQFKHGGGILGVKNLYEGGAYDDFYPGMQYYGKGGTSVARPFGKISQNWEKQAKRMRRGAAVDPEVMGMMYWTTTGLNESIRKRNDTMWSVKNVNKLKKLWQGGLAEAIKLRLASNVDPTSHASGALLKTFMPNIVMIDFADELKCREIYQLNSVAAADLTAAAIEFQDA